MKIAFCASVAVAALCAAAPALAVTGTAAAGLQTLRELNVTILQNLSVQGGETEGKVYVGGDFNGGNTTQVGFGNSQQGEAVSSRATLTVGGALNARVNLSDGPNGGNGTLGSYGATVVGSANGFDLHNNAALVNVGGTLGSLGLSDLTTLNVTGGLNSNLDLRNGNTVRIGGSVGTVQGGGGGNVYVSGNIGTLQFGSGNNAYVGGSIGGGNLSQNQRVEAVGAISNMNLGNNNIVKSGASISNVNGSNGTTVYAAGSISGNANGASFNSNYAYNAVVTAPATPTAPVVLSQANATAQIDADLKALSSTLGGLATTSNAVLVTTGQGFTFRTTGTGPGYAVFNVDQTIFGANEFGYDFGSTTLPVIINVINSNATLHLNDSASYSDHANFIGNARANNQQVIWNFTDAASLDLQRQFQGSVLAPWASLSGNVVEGSVAARNFAQSNEVHLGTYNGGSGFLPVAPPPPPPPSVPEPANWALLLAGFGMVGFSTRRSRRSASAKMLPSC